MEHVTNIISQVATSAMNLLNSNTRVEKRGRPPGTTGKKHNTNAYTGPGAGGDRRSISYRGGVQAKKAKEASILSRQSTNLKRMLSRNGAAEPSRKRTSTHTPSTSPLHNAGVSKKRSKKTEVVNTPHGREGDAGIINGVRNMITEVQHPEDEEGKDGEVDSDREAVMEEVEEDFVSDDDDDDPNEELHGNNERCGNREPGWYKKETRINAHLREFGECLQKDVLWKGINIRESIKVGQSEFQSGDPVTLTFKDLMKGVNPGPKYFYLRNATIFVWDPETLYGLKITCIKCGVKGCNATRYSRVPRIITGMDRKYYLFSREYRCGSCKKEFSTTNIELRKNLPLFCQYSVSFPFVLTKKSGLTIDVVKLLKSGVNNGMVPSKVKNLMMERQTEMVAELEVQYYDCIRTYIEKDQAGVLQVKITANNSKEMVEEFRTMYDDPYGCAGKVPSVGYLLYHFKRAIEMNMDFLKFDMHSKGTGGAVCFDHTFGFAKRQRDKTYSAIFDCMNPFNEIIGFLFTPGTDFSSIKCYLKEREKASIILGQPQISYAYCDLCCSISNGIYEACPGLLKDTSKLALLPLPAKKYIKYVDSDSSVCDAVIADLYNKISEPSRDKVLVGLDTEYTIADQDERDLYSHRICVIQLCFHLAEETPNIVIIHVKKKFVSPVLKNILQHENVLLSGRSIWSQDIRLLNSNFGLKIKEENCLQLENIFVDAALIPSITDRTVSLLKLTEIVLGYTIDKSEYVRRTNWNKRVLSEMEQEYCARDAKTSYLIGKKYFQLIAIKTYRDEALSGVYGDDEKKGVEQLMATEEAERVRKEESRKLILTRVLLDAIHAMWRITDEIPTRHPFRPLFMTMLRDTIFTLNNEDVENVKRVCTNKWGISFEEKFAKSPKWVLHRVRRKILPPNVLGPALTALINSFKHEIFEDPKTKLPLLNKKALDEADQLIKEHVLKGCLSDPPEDELTLYYLDGVDADGLNKYFCTRGDSALEGFHMRLNQGANFYNAGPEYVEAYTLYMIFCRNLRTSAKRRSDHPFPGHYSTWLYSIINKATKNIYGEAIHNYWSNMVRGEIVPDVSSVPFGFVSPVAPDEHFNEVVDEEYLKGLTTNERWRVKRQRQRVTYQNVQTLEEKYLFKKTVSKYISNRTLDAELYSAEWNSGMLRQHISQQMYTKRGNPQHDGVRSYVRDGGCTVKNRIFKKTPRMLEKYFEEYSLKMQQHALLEASKKNINEVVRLIKKIKKDGTLVIAEGEDAQVEDDDEDDDQGAMMSRAIMLSDALPPPTLSMATIPVGDASNGGIVVTAPPLTTGIGGGISPIVGTSPVAKTRKRRTCTNCGMTWDPTTRSGCIRANPNARGLCKNPPLQPHPPASSDNPRRATTARVAKCGECGLSWNGTNGCIGANKGKNFCMHKS